MVRRLAFASTLSLVVLGTLCGLRPAAAEPQNTGFVAIDDYVAAQMSALRIPGSAVGVLHDGQVVHVRGLGVADPTGRPVTPQTPFRLASVSKTLTALAVMQLVESGQLNLDSPVSDYLPWFGVGEGTTDTANAAAATVRDLMHHTSGIPGRAGNDDLFNGDDTDVALERHVRRLTLRAFDRPGAATYEYSNVNYDVAGLLVAQVSGQSFESYVQNHIFSPLGLRHSFTSQAAAQADGMATGYRQWFGFPLAAALPDDRATRPSSFLISSAEDMTRLLTLLLDGGRTNGARILGPSAVEELHRPTVSIGSTGSRSAMGLDVGQMNGQTMLSKTGGTANYFARIVILPESRWGVVVLANTFDIGLGKRFEAIADGVAGHLVSGQSADPVSAPIGGGNVAIKGGLVATALIVAVLTVRSLRRRTADGAPKIGRSVLALVPAVVLGVLLLIVVPWWTGTSMRFLFYFTPDVFWLVLVVAALTVSGPTAATLRSLQAHRR